MAMKMQEKKNKGNKELRGQEQEIKGKKNDNKGKKKCEEKKKDKGNMKEGEVRKVMKVKFVFQKMS